MVLWYMDVVINWIFTVEVLMKLFGEDFHVWTYFNSAWNKFDFVIVFFSWLPLFLSGELPFPIKLLRLLRLFRVLRVIKFLPALALIVEAIYPRQRTFKRRWRGSNQLHALASHASRFR